MKVSVLITSYNHADTLKRAIDSVLMQKTDFRVEIICIDDSSIDGSSEILQDYFPKNMIHVLRFGEHRGMMKTYQLGFKECTGDYICLCDCDDYWWDEYKLQKQVDYMENHPDCGLCVTKCYTESNGNRTGMNLPSEITYDKLLRGNANVHAQTYMIRKSDFDKYIHFERFLKFNVWDYPIVLELIQHCTIDCLDFYSAVYNKRVESKTNSQLRLRRLKYILGTYQIRLYYILKYGCKFNTLLFLIYKFMRDIASIILKRWNG